MRRLMLGVSRPVAKVAVILALGLIVGALACSFIVNDGLPTYMCTPGASNACPGNQVCAAIGAGQYRCCDPATQCGHVGDSDGSNNMMGDDGGLPADAVADVRIDIGAMGDAAGSNDAAPCTGFACKCATTSDCPTGFACVDKRAVTSDIWSACIDAGAGNGAGWEGGSGGVCMEPCCTSNDCDTGDGGIGDYVCFATGAGGNYCVRPGWLGDRSTIGANVGGAACGGDAGSCRSGLCNVSGGSGACADTCCSTSAQASECAAGVACRFLPFPGSGFDTHWSAQCAVAPPNTGGGRMNCQFNQDCRSNLCVGAIPGSMRPSGVCEDACRKSIDCTGTGMMRFMQTCSYVAPNTPTPSTEIVAACTPAGGFGQSGDSGAGDLAPCTVSSDCARGSCMMQSSGRGLCISVCFVDSTGSTSDCSGPNTDRCRPQTVQLDGGIYSVLACGM